MTQSIQQHQSGQSPAVYDVDGFCADHHISRSLLYKLWKDGRGPAVVKVGTRTLITTEAAAKWRASLGVAA